MSCPAAGRGHRRSWSWPAMESRTCCAGRSMSGTDPGMPGCPGSSPPGFPSGTATTWSAYAPMRYGAWRTRPRTRGCRAACWTATAGSGRGPRPHPSPEAPAIPGRSPGKMTRSGNSALSAVRRTRSGRAGKACCTTDSEEASQTRTHANDHASDRIAGGSKPTAAFDVNVPGCLAGTRGARSCRNERVVGTHTYTLNCILTLVLIHGTLT